MSTATIRRASIADLDALAPLFDAYRRFYEQPADPALARRYLEARLSHDQAVVFVADAGDGLVGFCLLYPTWCSVAAAPIYTLYDLFVAEAARRGGTGRALMLAAQAHAREAGVARMDLTTAHDNARAQALYESLGWRRDEVFRTYNFVP